MITVYFNRKTGECFAASDSRSCLHLEATLFIGGLRDRKDFEVASSSGFIQIQQKGPHLNVTTHDDPSILS